AHLGHGAWLTWLEREFAWSDRTARRMIEVAQRFRSDTVANLPIETGALYLLAAPKTPEPAVTEALTLAQQGETITQPRAKELIDKYRPTRTGAPSTEKDEVPVGPGTTEALPIPSAPPACDTSQEEADATTLGGLDVRAPVQGTLVLEAHASPRPGAPVTQGGDPATAGPGRAQRLPRVAALTQACATLATLADRRWSVEALVFPTSSDISGFVADLAADQLDTLQEALDHAMQTLTPLTRLVNERLQQTTPGVPPAPPAEPPPPPLLQEDASPTAIHAAIVAVLSTLPARFTSDDVVHRTGGRPTAVGCALLTMVKSGELSHSDEDGRYAVVEQVGEAAPATERTCAGQC